MAGLKAPSTSLDYYQHFGNVLRKEGDVEMGVAINAPMVQVLWHASPLLEDLYIGFKFGYIDYTYSNWSFATLCVGVPVSYQLIGMVRVPTGIVHK